MKIERKEVEFAPIVLTIESQMELDILSELVSLAEGVCGIPEEVENIVSELSEYLLNEGASPQFKYFCGSLRAK